MNGYDTVFANAKDEELEFETMFDQEDDLIDTIVGCNECGDPLTGADPCPVATADDRSSDDNNPDYEKDVDASDSKDAPNDAEGTVGYDFETKPEIDGKVDDSTTVDVKDVKVDEGFDFYLEDDEEVVDNDDKGVEDTVTGTIENDKDVMESYFEEAEAELGYEETDTEKKRITDAPLQTPDDIEAVAKQVSEDFDFYLEDDEEVVDNDDKGVEDTVTGTIENDKDIDEGFDFSLDEADDPLNGQDTNSEVNAKERSCDDCDPDYDIDIDASDSKDAPKDAEGTVGYDFEVNPEIDGKVDDSTTVDVKDVKVDEGFDFYLEDEKPEDSSDDDESDDDDDDDLTEDVDFDITIPKDAEGTVGYDFEVNPEIGSRDDDSTVDADEVKVDEGFDFYLEEDEEEPEGSEKTVPEEEPTIPIDNCKESADDGFDFSLNEADDIKLDKDVEEIEDPESYLDDDAIDDTVSKDPNANLEYDPSDEEVIDFVINND